jgi:hypothetical protein
MDLTKAKVFSQGKTLTQYKNKIRMIIVVYRTISYCIAPNLEPVGCRIVSISNEKVKT